MTPFVEKYTDTHLGELVIMLSLDGVQPLLTHVRLDLAQPHRLQELCRYITSNINEAVYDEDAMGWKRHFFELSDLFKRTGIASLVPEDQRKFLFWLENGTTATMHSFPHRNFWQSAFRWALNAPEALDPSTIDAVGGLAQAITERKNDPEYDTAKETLAMEPESFMDTFQKTKFHINIVPGAIVSQHLIGLNAMRRAHIMREECEAFVLRGGNILDIEQMVLRYADTEVTSKWLAGYVADRASFDFASLWSNTFREGVQ